MVYLEYQFHVERFVKNAIINADLHKIIEQDLTVVQKQAVAKAASKKRKKKAV